MPRKNTRKHMLKGQRPKVILIKKRCTIRVPDQIFDLLEECRIHLAIKVSRNYWILSSVIQFHKNHILFPKELHHLLNKSNSIIEEEINENFANLLRSSKIGLVGKKSIGIRFNAYSYGLFELQDLLDRATSQITAKNEEVLFKRLTTLIINLSIMDKIMREYKSGEFWW
ncbi:hypothetical protein L1267_15320 [Pseudoalteromonas sp. OFAV1]|uniref:hypothetical protein n=1 Tax=Pseudoalteromonas sp. OFAV1 TaxID=2908892 RepID=UPI001F1F6E45|nr:hypothetical protein [Pseudoalteromonas sp. OFAV1]MCF2901744.1 hypothetical protein [Pseudoalteromonas sp. OFAV1]